ncbi:MAG: hypothetical protein C4347_01670 [Patescibacteria group bacterium]
MKVKLQIKQGNRILREWDLNEKQARFVNSTKKYVLYSGGFGCGKTLALTIKCLQLALAFPNNYGLIGRLRYSDLRNTVLKMFFDVCPPEFIKYYNKQDHHVVLVNGSEIIFRHLDKASEQGIRSLNLGFFAVDQAEEINENMFDALAARLRKDNVPIRQGLLTCNPSINWLFKFFKQDPKPDYDLIEGSTLDNKENLPEDYVEELLSKPESYRRQFVFGEWNESLLSDDAVFPMEHIKTQELYVRRPIKYLDDDIEIFKEPISSRKYQIGIDPSEGQRDYSAIVAFENTGEQVAFYRGRVPADVLAEKAVKLAQYLYNAVIVPEVNGIGVAVLMWLVKQKNYPFIYIREEVDRQTKAKQLKYGWRTTFATKPLLVENFKKILRENKMKIRSRQVVEEMKTFIYSGQYNKAGMGAKEGFYDDAIMATMLALWNFPLITEDEHLEELLTGKRVIPFNHLNFN